MHQWYLSFDGKQFGPLDTVQAQAMCTTNRNGLCWRQGYAEWLPISQAGELSNAGGPSVSLPPPPRSRNADEIDYRIFGEDMQYVEVELDPGESAVAEAGAMMFKDSAVRMETVFGDGSRAQSGGFFDKLVGAGKRLLTGESLFTTVFTHGGTSGKAKVGFAAPYPGTIIPLHLSNFNGRIICQKDSFLCAAKGVQIGIYFQKKILTGLFGGEGFIMQKLEGDGLIFIHAGGTIRDVELQPGQSIQIDTGCLVALTDTVTFDIQRAGNIKSMLFAGEGLFLANVTGPGHVWMQSLPFSRMAGRMLAAVPGRGGSREEGSILGGLGNLLDGDGL